MTATGLWPPLAAPLLNVLALLLALGFRRNRAVLALVTLTFASVALAGLGGQEQLERGADAARMFAPWLLLATAALPERSLLARRNLILLLLLAIAAWLTLAAPPHVWSSLRGALPLGALPWRAGTIAAALAFLAAGLCLLRWVLTGAPMEAGLGIVLTLAGCALLPVLSTDAVRAALGLAGLCSCAAVLYVSYRMAFIDALSGLPNRRALDETLSRLSGEFAVAMVDVDHFKHFNDTHGHDAGDRVLQSVALQLRRTHSGRAFRYGGEEFCLLFTGARVREAGKSCEDARARIEAARVRIRSAPDKRRKANGKRETEVKVTASIGLAMRDNYTRYPSDVLKAADQALYKAKAKGRNRVVSR